MTTSKEKPTPKKTVSLKETDTVVNYMVVNLSYNINVCLPYEDGIALLTALEKSEPCKTYYSHEKLQFADEVLEVNFKIITQKEYRESKMNKLLGVAPGDENDGK